MSDKPQNKSSEIFPSIFGSVFDDMPASNSKSEKPVKAKLSPSEIKLLTECCNYSICELSTRREYIRLGGSGTISIRYNYRRSGKLKRLGLLKNESVLKATQAGRDLIQKLKDEQK